jgi:NTP pyrophosphatase (non-canonical NTP hydrolase)
MTYYLYHIPGKKVGVTTNLEERVHKQQGYYPGEYEIIETSDDIEFISIGERIMQKCYGYKVDDVLYSKLKFNKNKNLNMNINVTEQTTTFPYPVNKLKGHLVDNIGMDWETEFGNVKLTHASITWIMKNVKESMYNKARSYVYNKAFARWFDNNDAYPRTGALADGCGPSEKQRKYCDDSCMEDNYVMFDLIREWADQRGLYTGGDPKTQALKLVEEVGETCRAILKQNDADIIDGIGDCVVVLVNLAELVGEPLERCIEQAYFEIKNRTGKMENGTFKKD